MALMPAPGIITQVHGQANQAGGAPWPHVGIDIAAPTGTPVVAIAPGRVIHAGTVYSDALADRFMLVRGSTGSGKFAILEHDGWFTLTAHHNTINVAVGQLVQRGEQYATVGTTGNSTGPHVHMETIDPRIIRNTYPFGRYNPMLQIEQEQRAADLAAANQPVHTPAPDGDKILTVTAPVAMVRTSPYVQPNNISQRYPHGIAKGAHVSVKGYVKGEDPYPLDGVRDDAWLVTIGGEYMWANGVGNDLTGLKYLGN